MLGISVMPHCMTQGDKDPVAAYGQGRLIPACGCPGVRQPADHLGDLGRMAVRDHAGTQARKHLPQRGAGPMDTMVPR